MITALLDNCQQQQHQQHLCVLAQAGGYLGVVPLRLRQSVPFMKRAVGVHARVWTEALHLTETISEADRALLQAVHAHPRVVAAFVRAWPAHTLALERRHWACLSQRVCAYALSQGPPEVYARFSHAQKCDRVLALAWLRCAVRPQEAMVWVPPEVLRARGVALQAVASHPSMWLQLRTCAWEQSREPSVLRMHLERWPEHASVDFRVPEWRVLLRHYARERIEDACLARTTQTFPPAYAYAVRAPESELNCC